METVTEHNMAVETPSPLAYAPVSLSNSKVLNSSPYTKQLSKGLFTPCRQVGLRRRPLKNVISPSNICGDKLSMTPRSLRFVSPVGNRSHRKFNGSVLGKNTPHKKEIFESLSERPHLENVNEKTKNCNYEMAKDLNDEHEETTEKIPSENSNNQIQQSNIGTLYCKDSDFQSNTSDEPNVISSKDSDGEKAIENIQTEHLHDTTQQFSVDTPSYNDLDLQSNSSDEPKIITSEGSDGERTIAKTQRKHFYVETQQCSEHTPFCKNVILESNSSVEHNMVNSEEMIEYTEKDINLLKQRITKKEKEIERLKLVLLYKKKHNLKDIAKDIRIWKEGCQETLQRLQQASIIQGHQLTITQVLETFGIPPSAVGYNEDIDDFE